MFQLVRWILIISALIILTITGSAFYVFHGRLDSYRILVMTAILLVSSWALFIAAESRPTEKISSQYRLQLTLTQLTLMRKCD